MRAAAPFDQHRFCCTAWRRSLCSRRFDCGSGHNIRKILAHLRALLAALLASLIQAIDRAERDQITAQAAWRGYSRPTKYSAARARAEERALPQLLQRSGTLVARSRRIFSRVIDAAFRPAAGAGHAGAALPNSKSPKF